MPAPTWTARRTSLGDYTDYVEAYDAELQSMGGIANYFYFQDAAGNLIVPHQDIIGTEHFKKLSQEVRIATPKEKSGAGADRRFLPASVQPYFPGLSRSPSLAPNLSVNGWPGTIWLTLQDRVDRDWAVFGEGEFDVTPKITLIAGGRLYPVRQQPVRLCRLRQKSRFRRGRCDFPPNGAGASSGVRRCLTVNGEQLIDDRGCARLRLVGSTTRPARTSARSKTAGAVPKHTKGNGFSIA